MLKKIFKYLAFFGFVTVIGFTLALLYSKANVPHRYPLAIVNKTMIVNVDELAAELLGNGSPPEPVEDTKVQQKTPTKGKPPPTKKSLEPCPEYPTELVGPLLIEFNVKRKLEDMRKEDKTLQMGGRYKPPNCISPHKVAIIVPFRNRHEHLRHWLYYMHPILKRQDLDYGIYIINQAIEGRFNRAKLLNVGFKEALKEYDYNCFVFSDVDLVPLDDRNLYRCFDNPRHLAVAMDKFQFHLPYEGYFGGVSSMSKKQFEDVNGFPNTYWGWGGEDDDIYYRIFYRGMSISRPDLVTGRYRMIKHGADLHNEPNPVNPGKLSRTKITMEIDGLNSLRYKVLEVVKDVLFTFITVDIEAPPA